MSNTKNNTRPLNLNAITALTAQLKRKEEERDALFERWADLLLEEEGRVADGHDPIFLERRLEDALALLEAERSARAIFGERKQGLLEARSEARSFALRKAVRRARRVLREYTDAD